MPAPGWEYLHDMFLRWFGGPDNFSKLERDREDLYNNHLGNPFWIDWDWVMQFERARATYASFTAEPYSLEQPNHIFNTAARNSLGRILQREGMLRQNAQVDFDFIAVPWTHYKRYYHTLAPVPALTPSDLLDELPDGLMAALEKFTLRALAAGYTRHLGDDRYEICIQRVGVFAHDIFQFAEDRDFLGNQLGGWSCATKKGARARVDGDFVWLNNSYFRLFSNTHHFGNNFVVLSQMHHVDIAQEVSYVYTCS